jgi:hypothetical protein
MILKVPRRIKKICCLDTRHWLKAITSVGNWEKKELGTIRKVKTDESLRKRKRHRQN